MYMDDQECYSALAGKCRRTPDSPTRYESRLLNLISAVIASPLMQCNQTVE